MRKVELMYVEVINETEQIFIFKTIFNKTPYAILITLNTALSIEVQDSVLAQAIVKLATMTQKDANNAVGVQ